MGARLPELDPDLFAERLAAASPVALNRPAVERLHAHYLELARWNPRLSLVGPGDRERVVERHYAESLAAVPWIGDGPRRLVDVGSGGGFPGLVLAAALPSLRVTLVEPRERKWSFLMAAARRSALPCVCLNARVGALLPDGLPERYDLVTVRALRLAGSQIEALGSRMGSGGAFLFWSGASPPAAPGFAESRRRKLPGSNNRFLVEVRRREPR